MNLWVKGKGLLFLIMLLVLFSSCEEEESTIGLPVENNLDLKFFEYEVPVEMIWVDSVRSGLLGTLYSGKFDHEEAGMVKAIPFISFAPQRIDTAINIPEDAVFKDFYLDLDISASMNRTINSTESIQVYQLADTIDSKRSHFIEDETPLGALLGEKTFTFIPDSLKLDQEQDSIDYRERVALNPALGEDLFNKLVQEDPSTFKSIKEFASTFKGIALVPGEDSKAIVGYSAPLSRIVIVYEYPDDGTIKTGRFAFNTYSYYHNITPNKETGASANAPFAGLPCCYEGFTPNDGFVYQFFGTGINVKLDLSKFKMFADTLSNVLLNKATLEIGGVESMSEFRSPPSTVAFYLTNEDGHRITREITSETNTFKFYQTLSIDQQNPSNPDPLRIGSTTEAVFNSKTSKYAVNMTLVLQHIIENESDPDQLIMELGDDVTTAGDLARTASFISGIKIPGNSFKIKLYYSTIE